MLAQEVRVVPEYLDDAVDHRRPIRVHFQQAEEGVEMLDQDGPILLAAALKSTIDLILEDFLVEHEGDIAQNLQDELFIFLLY